MKIKLNKLNFSLICITRMYWRSVNVGESLVVNCYVNVMVNMFGEPLLLNCYVNVTVNIFAGLNVMVCALALLCFFV